MDSNNIVPRGNDSSKYESTTNKEDEVAFSSLGDELQNNKCYINGCNGKPTKKQKKRYGNKAYCELHSSIYNKFYRGKKIQNRPNENILIKRIGNKKSITKFKKSKENKDETIHFNINEYKKDKLNNGNLKHKIRDILDRLILDKLIDDSALYKEHSIFNNDNNLIIEFKLIKISDIDEYEYLNFSKFALKINNNNIDYNESIENILLLIKNYFTKNSKK